MGASMILVGLFSLFFPVLGLLLVAWAVLTIWRAVTLPRGSGRVPACENCKYAVADLSSFICPECGQDLRRVGIVTPRIEATRRGSLAGAIIAWTFLCIGGLYVVFMIAMLAFGASQTFSATASASQTWQQTLIPNSGAYQSVVLAYDSDFQSVTGPIVIELTSADGATHELSLDPGPMTASGMKDGDVDWNDDTILAWFGETGLDTTDPQVAAGAKEAASVVDLVLMSPGSAYTLNLTQHTSQIIPVGGFAGGGAFTGGGFASMGVVILGSLCLGVLVYGLGIFWMVRRRRGLLRRSAEL